MDLVHKASKMIERNRYTAAGVAAALALVGLVAAPSGCAGTITSAMTGERITVEQFQAELEAARIEAEAAARSEERTVARTVAAITAQAERDIAAAIGEGEDLSAERETAIATLGLKAGASWDAYEREQATKRAVFETLGSIAGTAYPGIAPFLGTAGILLGVGAFADSRRKDRIISLKSTTHPGSGA